MLAVTFKPVFTTNEMTSDFLIVHFHSLSDVHVSRHHYTGLTFRSWLDLLGVVLAFYILDILKFFKSLKKADISCKNMYRKDLSLVLLLRSSFLNKEDQRRSEYLLVGFKNRKAPSTTTVCPIDNRKDYMSCAWPFHSLVQPDALHSYNATGIV